MEKFVIEGGTPLAGTVTPAGNKNAALPALAACLLTREEVVLRNIPRISDVEAMLEILRLLGVDVEWRDDNVVALQAADLTQFEVDRDWASGSAPRSCSRAAPRAPGPRQHAAAGGDVIGRRRLDPHLDAFRALGAEVNLDRSWYPPRRSPTACTRATSSWTSPRSWPRRTP
jgi:UDP-N-acetylglucosamine 1-carboxyvinyltransferase